MRDELHRDSNYRVVRVTERFVLQRDSSYRGIQFKLHKFKFQSYYSWRDYSSCYRDSSYGETIVLTLVQQTTIHPRMDPDKAMIAAITKKTNIAVMVEKREEISSQSSKPLMSKVVLSSVVHVHVSLVKGFRRHLSVASDAAEDQTAMTIPAKIAPTPCKMKAMMFKTINAIIYDEKRQCC